MTSLRTAHAAYRDAVRKCCAAIRSDSPRWSAKGTAGCGNYAAPQISSGNHLCPAKTVCICRFVQLETDSLRRGTWQVAEFWSLYC